MNLTFCGATGTVTGSRYLLEHGSDSVLVDCGLFQGLKQLRRRNWEELPFDAARVSRVLLTHAHIDHSGFLPVLVRKGFRGEIVCSGASHDLCGILLPDAAYLQEEEARYANKRGFSRHQPALPLFTSEHAKRALALFRSVEFAEEIEVGPGLRAQFLPAGHILGSAMILLKHDGKQTLFSGDVGRPHDPVMRPPLAVERADNVICESTYGNRRHAVVDPEAELGNHLSRALRRNGIVIIPAFAVGRVQTLLLLVSRLKKKGVIPDVPVYLNSPIAVDATRIYHEHRGEHRLTPEECAAACKVSKFVNTVDESKALNHSSGPSIIISASGMATGGRVVHHLKAFAPDPKNMILFAGYQTAGTRSASLVGGASWTRIHGQDIPVRAEVVNIEAFSAHADFQELSQ